MVHHASDSASPGDALGRAFAALILGALALVAPVVFFVLGIIQMQRVYRRARRRQGKYTPFEHRLLDGQRHRAAAWEHARSVRSWLIARRVPKTMQQWDVIPQPGEVFFARLNLQYARYYGQDVTYSTRGGFFFGHPAFVVGALAVTAIANSHARSNAQAQAAAQWRELQPSVVWVTNRRLIVHANGGWMTFAYDQMSAVYPEVSALTLVCQFQGTSPMLLAGDDAPIAAIYTVLQTYGPDALAQHPSLRALDSPAAEPVLPAIGREAPSVP